MNKSVKSSDGGKHRWIDLPKRLLTISIAFPILVWILKHRTTRKLFFVVVHFLASWEWMSLIPTHENGESLFLLRSFFSLLSIMLSLASNPTVLLSLLVMSASVFYLFSTVLSISSQGSNDYTPRTSMDEKLNKNILQHTLMGLIFLTIPFFYWIQLSSSNKSTSIRDSTSTSYDPNELNCIAFQHVLYVLCIVWNCDSGALVMGRLFGSTILRTNPSQRIQSTIFVSISMISPTKTFPGVIGGLLSGILTAIYFPLIFTYTSMSFDSWGISPCQYGPGQFAPQVNRPIFLGFILSLCAMFGDLVESAVKRKARRKDSGSLLPGHGKCYE